jgi:uncharacterized protein (TIGR02453 family)
VSFPPKTFEWFRGLEADNTREWFQAHRAVYDAAVRGPLEDMLEELCDEYGGRVKMFRQHRDVRFSRDKSPYKTTTYGVIADRPSSPAALYAQLSAGGLFVGTGYYMLDGGQLARFRDAVIADASIAGIVDDVRAAGVEVFGSALKTAPRGLPKDHPRVELLRHKSLVAGARLEPGARGISRSTAQRHARRVWGVCEPMNAWLDEHVGTSRS